MYSFLGDWESVLLLVYSGPRIALYNALCLNKWKEVNGLLNSQPSYIHLQFKLKPFALLIFCCAAHQWRGISIKNGWQGREEKTRPNIVLSDLCDVQGWANISDLLNSHTKQLDTSIGTASAIIWVLQK